MPNDAVQVGAEVDGEPHDNPLLIPEILALVLSHLSAFDLARAAAVCRLWCKSVANEGLWQQLYKQDWQRQVGSVRAPIGWEADRPWRLNYAERHRMHGRWLRRTYTDIDLLDSYGHVGPVRLLGEYIVAAVGWDIRVWNRQTRLVCKELVGHSAPILCMECAGIVRCRLQEGTFHNAQDRTAKIWTLHSEDVEHTLIGHTGPVAAVAMHGTHAATLAHEIRIWDMETGTCLYALDAGEQHGAFAGVVLGSGVTMAACLDNTLHIWRHQEPVRPAHLISLGENAVMLDFVYDAVQGVALVPVQSKREGGVVLKTWDPVCGELAEHVRLACGGDAGLLHNFTLSHFHVDEWQYAAFSVGSGEHILVLGDRKTGSVVQLFELHHAGSRVTHYELPEQEDVVAVDYGVCSTRPYKHAVIMPSTHTYHTDACGVVLKFAQVDGSCRLMLRDYAQDFAVTHRSRQTCSIS